MNNPKTIRDGLAFGLNRLDHRSPLRFAADAARLEGLGWHYGFLASSPLLVQDPYVLLAQALRETRSIMLGTLIENPVMRHPAVIAGSVATIDRLDPGRMILGMGVGDTAVRLMGKRPATVAAFEEAIVTIKSLTGSEQVAVDAARPAVLRHASPVPVWVATQGPRTLRMAGRVADGVFIRVGAHETNLRLAIDHVHTGAREAGRDPSEVRVGCVFHTIADSDPERVGRIGRAAAAGYYEYSPVLFENIGMPWTGEDSAVLKRQVWPDFHHDPDLEAAGDVVSFLPDEAVDAFTLHGSFEEITEQIKTILGYGLPIEIVIPHPMPTPLPISEGGYDYARRFAEEVFPAF
ncbi:MAG: LLM class flavin-dependent oxidoreductase [Gammaproteobacteria bacterium]|nr:LLM class flavin-dependent oxidoreductase [Gammaproteobacteria bacterium]